MKFLDTKEILVTKDDIEIIFKPVSFINQSTLLGYQADLNNAVLAKDVALNVQAQMKTVAYALNEMVSSIDIKGESFDPIEIAGCADPSDGDTLSVLKKIYSMVTDLLVQGKTKKKSSKPLKSTSKAKGVKDAPAQIEG